MKLIYTLLFSCAALGAFAAPKIEKPVKDAQPTSFAIIVDSKTYDASRPAIMRYRDAVENDGLSTYIIHDEWANPQAVRDAIKQLYSQSPNLEGIVIVGDVPVAMVRNAQHMTTAFKMNEDTYPFIDSSVPTDRYYDCLDMDFRYLKQDEEQPHLFYFELTEDSPQSLNPTFYSARIRYPKLRGGDKYQAISAFLDKAAKAKESMKDDKLDQVVSFNGHGYNSDCLIAWMDEEKAYRENFPLAFENATSFKHWNFRMAHPMKYIIFEELQRPEVDVFMFHEHGAPEKQYINGEKPSSSVKERYNDLRSSLYSLIRRHTRNGKKTEEELIEKLCKEYGLTPQLFKDLHNDSLRVLDSIAGEEINISAAEFHNRKTYPKFVMFDACYNGSFHEDEYIAGEYIFNDGGTLVAQGNTRNVLQDRWTIEMIGLLSHGMRAGQYNRIVATLEGHMLGDPTVRFAPIAPNTLSADATTRKHDTAYWTALLDAPYADVRMLAMRMLADADTARTFSPTLLEIYRTSPFNTVRMEAVKLLSRYNDANFVEAVRLGVNDPYELVSRLCADYAGNIGDPALLPDMVTAYLDCQERSRAAYTLSNSLALFPKEDVAAAVNDFYARNNRYKGEAENRNVIKQYDRQVKFAEEHIAQMTDTTLTDAKRTSAIRFVRNNPYHQHLDTFFDIVENNDNSDHVRVIMAEALGWFDNSYRRKEIIDFCNKMLKQPDLPQPVAAELTQTLNRLN